MKEIIFVTGNENKLFEAKSILENHNNTNSKHENNNIKVISKKIDLDEYQGSIEEIALKKAKHACDLLNAPCFVDDASLCFDALNGMPGPYIKHFEQAMGTKNLPRLIDFSKNKKGHAICSIGYCEPGKDPHCFIGKIEVDIVESRGDNGFGWDLIIQPKGFDKTFAEMHRDEKNKISHRLLALNKLKDFLE